MAGVQCTRRRAAFESGYVETNPVLLWLYRRALDSPALRDAAYRLPRSRLRTAVVARFFRLLFDLWARGNLDPTLRAVDPNIRVEMFGLGTYKGPEGMRQAWKEWQASFAGLRIEVAEILDSRRGEVVTVARLIGHGVSTDLRFNQDTSMVWTIVNGIGVRARIYSTKREAIEAAGLSE